MNCYEDYDNKFDETDEKEIRNLLLYHKIVKVTGNTLILDNGTTLTFEGNQGCGGCNSGWYDVTELNTCENVITNVEFAVDKTSFPDEYGKHGTSYKIFVYAEDRHIKIAQVDGNDGNGYYGTGYTLYVKFKKQKISTTLQKITAK